MASLGTTCAPVGRCPARVLTAVTGVSGSGKSTLVTQVLAQVVRSHFGLTPEVPDEPELAVDVVQVVGLDVFRPACRCRSAAHWPHSSFQPGHVHRNV